MRAATLKACLPRSGQRGTVLVVALLILIVMTVLGIAVLNSSTMQTFMSTAYQAQMETLAEAENNLRAGEDDVDEIRASGPGERTYYFPVDSGADGFAAEDLSTEWANSFVIERVRGPRDDSGFPIIGESIAVGGGLDDSSICVFRIWARGDGDRQGVRIVQSTYVTAGCPTE